MNRFLFACTLGACVFMVAAPKARAATNGSLVIGDARMVEPSSGQKSMIFPVTLSGVRDTDVRLSYATSVGSNTDSLTLAQPGFDFSSRQGQITIPAGTTRGQIEVPILGDSEVEKDETFVVSLSDIQSSDNSGFTVKETRVVAKGTIVEAVKGVVLGGKVLSYNVSPSAFEFDPISGDFADNFDKPAKAQGQGNVTLSVSNGTTSRIVSTDSVGNYSILVLPGTYTVQMQNFLRSDYSGNPQTYSLPSRKVSLSRDSRANNFAFYGVAGTVGVPQSGRSRDLSGAYVKVEARPVGASATSTPVASAIAIFFDQSLRSRPSRGYRFFIPALPAGRYTLSIKDVDAGGDDFFSNYYTTFFNFPSPTVTLPATGVNTPDAHVEIVGTPKSTFPSDSPSAGRS